MQIQINNIKNNLKEILSKDRFEHIISVMDTAMMLAVRFDADVEKARIAGLLHDVAKEKTVDESLEICDLYGYKPDKLSINSMNLLHGPVGALLIRDKYGIIDEDIFNSVFYHTTARENMTILEKVIFVADKIEPLNDFEGIDEIRDKALTDIDATLLMLLQRGIKRVQDRGDILHPRTQEAEKYYYRRSLNLNSKEIADVINIILTEKKGTDLNVIKIPDEIAVADYFVICNGTSVIHIKALADEVQEKLKKEHGVFPLHVEGYNTARWILMDYGDVIVHIFHKEDRDFYNLDKLWSDGLMNWRE